MLSLIGLGVSATAYGLKKNRKNGDLSKSIVTAMISFKMPMSAVIWPLQHLMNFQKKLRPKNKKSTINGNFFRKIIHENRFLLIHDSFIFHKHDSSYDKDDNHGNYITRNCNENMFDIDNSE